MKSKKSVELAFNTIVVAAIILIVLVVSIVIYTTYINKSTGKLDEQIGLLDDYDNDGTVDMFDKCPCDEGEADKCKTSREDCNKEMKK